MGKTGFRIKLWAVISAILVALGSSGHVYAAAECSLLQILINGKEIVSYVECDSGIHSAKAQVARYPCESVEIIQPDDISIHTVILLDNSLSISKSNRENIKNILRQYVQELPEKEVVSFAVFGEEIQFLSEKSQDTEGLLQLIDEIEFHDQNTFLTDYLFQAVEKIENDPEYTRFIVISDGVDNKAIGITKEELASKLKETPRPIYTIGHKYKDNSEELKNMFSLSRVTGGKEFLIDDFENIRSIVDEIHDFSHIYSIKTDIPQDVMDGGERHVLLNLQTDEGEAEVTGQVSMPFGLVESAPESMPEPTPEPTPEVVDVIETPEPDEEESPEQDAQGTDGYEPGKPERDMEKNKGQVLKIAEIIILAAAAALLILYQKKKKKNSDKQSNNDKPKKGKPNKDKPKKNMPVISSKPSVPEAMPDNPPVENATMILDGRYLLVLRDRANPERVFRYPMDGHVIVGRNTDMVQIPVDYNLTVSGRHCEFYIKNNRFFIRDINSANHTYLDGRMISGEAEIMSGNIVRLGEVEFSVEIMPI